MRERERELELEEESISFKSKTKTESKMSVFDIFSGIGSLANIAVRIYGAVKEVKSFKSQSKTIANRVDAILLPVRALQKEVDAKRVVLPDLERERAGSGPMAMAMTTRTKKVR